MDVFNPSDWLEMEVYFEKHFRRFGSERGVGRHLRADAYLVAVYGAADHLGRSFIRVIPRSALQLHDYRHDRTMVRLLYSHPMHLQVRAD